MIGTLIGGAGLTETVFAWPGIGRLMYEAGRREAEAEMTDRWSRVTAVVRGPDLDEIEARRWGPGGRAHFADPRPNDYPARTARRPELEASA